MELFAILEKNPLRDFLMVFVSTLVLVRIIQNWITSWNKSEDIYKAYRSLPGPRPLPLIGNGLMVFPKAAFLQKLVDLPKKYGLHYKISAFNENIVVLNSPEAAQALMMSNDMGYIRRGRLLERIWPEEIETMILYPGGEKWKTMRKLMAYPFKHRALKSHNHCFHKQSEKLVNQLEKRFKGGDGEHVDITVDLLKQCTFAISSETLMGVDLDDTGNGAMFCDNLDLFIKMLTHRVYRPWLLIPWVWKLSSEYKQLKEAMDKCRDVVLNVLEKFREKASREDGNGELSSTFIEAMLQNGVDEQLIFAEVAVLLGVANETTPFSAEQVLFYLSLHQDHQKLCHQEIDEVYNDPSKRKNGILVFEALKDMKHLERCINETLRINPLTIIMRQLESPLRINDELVIPTNVAVITVPYAIHRLPQYYPNPEIYDPYRFLPENVKQRHPYAFVPFSAGPRGCIGMKLAMIELMVMVATILRNFEVQTLDTREELQFVVDPTIKPSRPIRFTLKKRKLASTY